MANDENEKQNALWVYVVADKLRIKAKEGISRIFFCTVKERRIVLLHGFIKKTEKTPTKELTIARKRLQEVHHAYHTSP